MELQKKSGKCLALQTVPTGLNCMESRSAGGGEQPGLHVDCKMALTMAMLLFNQRTCKNCFAV